MQDEMLCEEHNKPFILVFKLTKGLCIACLQNRLGEVQLIDEFNQQAQERKNDIIQQQSLINDNFIKHLENYNTQLLIFKETVCNQITTLQQTVFEKIKFLKEKKEKTIDLIQRFNNLRIHELFSICKQRNSVNKKEIKAQLIKNVKSLQSQCNLDTLIWNLTYLGNEKILFKKIDYKFQENCILKNKLDCTTFAFNKKNTLLFIGCKSEIHIYSLKDGIIQQQLQRLSDHQNLVTSLQFLQKQNELISTSADHKIIVWQEDETQQWKSKQVLAAHNEWIISSTINREQNLLITGSYDQKIKFWEIKNGKWQISQELGEQYKATQLSLSLTESILVATGEERIIIIEKSQNQQWKIVQKIEVKEKGVRVCFVSDNEFIFQPNTQGVLEIYKSNQSNKEFQKVNQLQVNACKECQIYFPAQYLELLGLVVVKHGNQINFIKKESEKYQFIQSIVFEDPILFGRISENGKYLITWNESTNKIQMITLNYIQ